MGNSKNLTKEQKAKLKDLEPKLQKAANGSSGLGTPISIGLGEFDPDHPISSGNKEDRLGFRSVAEKLASSLLAQTTSNGLVISIEGEWGSGKSSLVNLLAAELKKNEGQPLEIVRFEPWLIGDRDGMLVELMSDLASAVDAIIASEKSRGEKLKEGTVKLSRLLRKYGSKLSRGAAPLARLAGLLGIPYADRVGTVLDNVPKGTDAPESPKPLPEIKEELTEGLRKLDQRIVVIIDDLDRLEPREVAEIMRLIRAVADFPNIIYVLCFDQEILDKSLKTALKVTSGTDFLEKMIQVRFKVPLPEAFDLRRWFLEECLAFYNFISGKNLKDDPLERLRHVCDWEGGLLKTPRDVVRAINAIKLYWPPISDKVDYPDLVWLQMVRLKNENLYSWIEQYLNEWIAINQGGAIINEDEKVRLTQQLKKLLPEEGVGSARSMWTFTEFVPGIQPGLNIEDKNVLFNLGNNTNISSLIDDRRLGSPEHSRYYFAFAKPAGALEDTELYNFISSAQSGENLEDLCIALIKEKRPQGGTKFGVLIDRLKYLDSEKLPDNAIPSILKALANCMDEEGRATGKGQWGVMWSWSSGKDLFKKLFDRLPDEDRSKIIANIFDTGESIGWLMCEIIMDKIFAHGRYDNKPQKDEKDWLFLNEELDMAIALLLKRFQSTDREKIIDVPQVLHLMYGWLQSNDKDGVMKWVQEQQNTDAGFMKLLKACRGWMQSDKTYYPLSRKDIQDFMNFDEVLERLKSISKNTNNTQAERDLAEELLQAAKIGDDR